MNTLNDVEQRVLGALVEKQISTPDYYPMTLNSLVNACNQKNHRDPVVSYVESQVMKAIESLRDKRLAFVFESAEGRTLKYKHSFPDAYNLDPQETAVLCVLMLRGPQTQGELRSRTPHLLEFESLQTVEETLQRLAAREEPLVAKLPRVPGTKESRYTHLLGGPVNVENATATQPAVSAAVEALTDPDRTAKLEAEVENLKREMEKLKVQMAEFRKQFE